MNPDKIRMALELVGIDMGQMSITFHGMDGYDVTCSAALVEQLYALHEHIQEQEAIRAGENVPQTTGRGTRPQQPGGAPSYPAGQATTRGNRRTRRGS